MRTIYNWLFGVSKRKSENQAHLIYQIREFDGKLWITFSGALVCPTDMFVSPPLDALSEIRKLYVERNTTHKSNEK